MLCIRREITPEEQGGQAFKERGAQYHVMGVSYYRDMAKSSSSGGDDMAGNDFEIFHPLYAAQSQPLPV